MTTECSDGTKNNQLTIMSTIEPNLVFGMSGDGHRSGSCDSNIRYNCMCSVYCGPGSVVGIATGYGLDSPGFEFRWGRDFPHLSRLAPGAHQPPVQWVMGLFRG